MSGPFNYQAELSALQSKQKLAEAMRQATMAGQLRTGGGLGGLVTALMRPGQLDRMERETLDAQAALQGRYKTELENELQNYLTTRQGRGENMFSPQEIAAAGGGAGVPQLPERPAVAAAKLPLARSRVSSRSCRSLEKPTSPRWERTP